MLDATIACGLGLLFGQLAAAAWLPSIAAAAGVLWFGRGHVRLRTAVLGVVALGVGALRARAAVGAYADDWWAVRHAIGAPARCEATARVTSSPVRAREPLRWDAVLTNILCEGRPVGLTLRARLYGGPEDLARGDILEIIADLASVQLLANEGLGDPMPGAAHAGAVVSGSVHLARRIKRGFGPLGAMDRLRDRVRRRIERTFLPDAVPMARALVLGESSLDPADSAAFRVSGTAHLLAVSGAHLVLVVLGAVRLLTAVLVRAPPLSARMDVGRIAAAAGVALALAYADFSGGTGSAWRAAAMLGVVLSARAAGRRPNVARALGLSLLVLALIDPLIAFDLSFTLSVGATIGLMVLARPIARILAGPTPVATVSRARSPADRAARRARAMVRATAVPLATTLAATAPCAPILACYGATWSAASIAANLLAVPLGEAVALPVCLLHAVSWPLPSLERGAAMAGSGALLALRAIARATASMGALVVHLPRPGPWQSAILVVSAVACLVAPRDRRLARFLASAAVLIVSEVTSIVAGRPRGTLRITVLDVGQGDASLIDFPDGSSMLVDGGGAVGGGADPGTTVVLPMLRSRRRSHLDAVVLSHPHPDHFLGLASALPEIGVGAFWDTGQGEREGAGPIYEAMLAGLRARGVPIVHPRDLCGRSRHYGAASMAVLGPCPDPVPFANANDNSFVLRISLGQRAALLVGDAQRAEETSLLDSGAAVRADFLKVGHHGSRTSSSPAFLAAVAPNLAVISCGVRNRFGHPAPATLAALAAARVRTMRTDCYGSVTWETDGRKVEVRSAWPGCR